MLISGGLGCGIGENANVPVIALVVELLVVRNVPVRTAVNVNAVVFVRVPSVSTNVAVLGPVFSHVNVIGTPSGAPVFDSRKLWLAVKTCENEVAPLGAKLATWFAIDSDANSCANVTMADTRNKNAYFMGHAMAGEFRSDCNNDVVEPDTCSVWRAQSPCYFRA